MNSHLLTFLKESITRLLIFKNASLFYIFILYSIYMQFLSNSFVITVILSFVLLYVTQKYSNNLLLSLSLIYLLSLQFIYPAKEYAFTYASPPEYNYDLYQEGIQESILFNVSDILGFMICAYFLLQVFIKSPARKKFDRFHFFTFLFVAPEVLITLICWITFLLLSLRVSIFQSSFPEYSINLILSQAKIIPVFMLILYLKHKRKRQFQTLLYLVLTSILVFNSLMGIVQFASKNSLSGSQNSPQIMDEGENTPFLRIQGISTHPNFHALKIAIITLLLLPYILKLNKTSSILILTSSAFNIFATQSRTMWGALLFLGLVTILIYKKKLLFENRQKFIYFKYFFSIILLLLFPIILPRLSSNSIFFSEDGGGLLRLKMIDEGLTLINQSFLGYGVGMNVKTFLSMISKSYAYAFPFAVHFVPIQLAIDSGVIAAFLFFVPIYLAIKKSFYAYKNKLLKVSTYCAVCCIILLLAQYCLQPMEYRTEFYYPALVLGFFYSDTQS